MGLFDRFKTKAAEQNQGQSLGPEEAFTAILVTTIASDGHLSNDEIQAVGTTLNRLKLFREMRGSQIERLIQKVFDLLNELGGPELVGRACEALPEELRLPTFINAVDLVFADGEVGEEEEAVIEDLVQHLNFDSESVASILDVLRLKNFAIADLSNAISGTSNNSNGVSTLSQSAQGLYGQNQMRYALNRFDELINALRR
jgi:uncharacterized tellurite resistance protein B-like protein